MAEPRIELREVYKSFGNNQVLRGVSLSARQGETLAIIGQSGVGKSVILKLMVGLIKPDRGMVLVDGEDINDAGEESLFRIRKKFGFLFQGSALLDSLTVEENVGLGLTEHLSFSQGEIRRIVADKLGMVGMQGVEDYLPSDLSGGMKKRVGLARAIAMEPEIILYDEPTTGLDPITADSINELIVYLKNRLAITSVVVTHDMTSVRRVADRVAMLHDGEIIFTGTIAELDITDDPVVRQFIEGRAEGPIKPAFGMKADLDNGLLSTVTTLNGEI
ncbi:MAG: ABC transporter ATP-binding protein [Candidatus Latescibacter sp.]|nr:ABC transporter ATP-binding protein [Candidatus Latescibacter sp.]